MTSHFSRLSMTSCVPHQMSENDKVASNVTNKYPGPLDNPAPGVHDLLIWVFLPMLVPNESQTIILLKRGKEK